MSEVRDPIRERRRLRTCGLVSIGALCQCELKTGNAVSAEKGKNRGSGYETEEIK